MRQAATRGLQELAEPKLALERLSLHQDGLTHKHPRGQADKGSACGCSGRQNGGQGETRRGGALSTQAGHNPASAHYCCGAKQTLRYHVFRS